MTKVKLISAVTVVVLLSACGNTQSDRALSGAGIGAGVGAVGAAVVSGHVLPAAIIGGAIGAAAGGLTNKDQIDLGKPAWR